MGNKPIASVANPTSAASDIVASLLPLTSPTQPNITAPMGLTKYVVAKAPQVSIALTSATFDGKKYISSIGANDVKSIMS